MHRLGVAFRALFAVQHLRCRLELSLCIGVFVLLEQRVAEVIMCLIAVLVLIQAATVVNLRLGVVLLTVLLVAATYVTRLLLGESQWPIANG